MLAPHLLIPLLQEFQLRYTRQPSKGKDQFHCQFAYAQAEAALPNITGQWHCCICSA